MILIYILELVTISIDQKWTILKSKNIFKKLNEKIFFSFFEWKYRLNYKIVSLS